MSEHRSLETVRREIDAIDDAIQDLIVRRTELVEEVRSIKHDWAVKIQPGREADIAYRLIKRHRGPFPKRELNAIWRQLINATLSFEGPFSISVYAPHGERIFWDLARDHFGSYTPMRREQSADTVIRSIVNQDATVGVLPRPGADSSKPWWRNLLADTASGPKVIARLPFITGSNAEIEGRDALAISPVAHVPTGRDRSCYVAEMSGEPPSPDAFEHELTETGLPCSVRTQWHEDIERQTWLVFLEFDGFVPCEDPRLQAAITQFKTCSLNFHALGGYAMPLSAAELAPADCVHADAPPATPATGRTSAP